MKIKLCFLLLLSAVGFPLSALSQGTAFTYQGRLTDAAGPATGLYDLTFGLYDGPDKFFSISAATPLGNGIITNAVVPVTNGQFMVTLDFGYLAFDGGSRWLEISVRPAGDTNFVVLAPRQAVTPSPYAIYANKALSASSASMANQANSAMLAGSASRANTVPASGITGVLNFSQLPAGLLTNGAATAALAGTFTGNGSGMTNVGLPAANAFGAIQWRNPGLAFLSQSTLIEGGGPFAVVAAKLHGGANLDLACASYSGNSVSVLTNRGSNFVIASVYPVGANPGALAAEDLNNDGKLDLVAANLTDNTLSVLFNNGAGQFGAALTLPVGSVPRGVVVADVNNDGWKDLICANTGDSTLTILTNNGAGGFAPASAPAVGLGPYALTAADCNGDGRVDLISADFSANTLTVLTNAGAGRFALALSRGVGHGPYAVTAVDLNGDGLADLACPNAYDHTLTVLTNTGNGGFVLAATPAVGTAPVAIAVGDVNSDGKPDLISANNYDGTVSILTNAGLGCFVAATTSSVGASPRWVATADLDGDGRGDLVTANAGDDSMTVLWNKTVPWLASFVGNGSGLANLSAGSLSGVVDFANLPATLLTNGATAANLSGSFAGDGSELYNLNLAAANSQGALAWSTNCWGRFVLSAALTNAGGTACSADVNGDGWADIIVGQGTATLVLTNNGARRFMPASVLPLSGPLALGDLNGDGKTDIVFSLWASNSLVVWTNAGLGRFAPGAGYPTPPHPGPVLVKDLNADGKADVAVAVNGNDTLLVLTNDGNGLLVTAASSATGVSPSDLQSADLNGDGRPDLVTANWGGTVSILLNSGSGRFSPSVISVTNATRSVALADVNGDAWPDIICATPYGGCLVVLTNNGAGAFAFSSTLVPAGIRPDQVVAADFSGDGQAELISSDMWGAPATEFTNNGAGFFSIKTNLALPGPSPQPGLVTVMDFDGDGHPDLLAPEFSANVVYLLANSPVLVAAFIGNGSALTNLDADLLAQGTVSDQRLSSNVALLDASQTFTGANKFTAPLIATNPASHFAGTFSGNGQGLTNLNLGASFVTGTLADARLSANVALLNASQTFSRTNNFSGAVGINTAVPHAPLDINTGAGNIQFRNDDGLVPAVNLVNGPNSGTLRLHNRLEIWPDDGALSPGSFDIRGTNGLPLISLSANGSALFNNPGGLSLGATNPAARLTVSGALTVDALNSNPGAISPGITFGSPSGEGIASRRTAGGNQYGLDLYTAWTPQLSLDRWGNVGIGTNAPAAKLDVATGAGNIQFRSEGGLTPGINIANSPNPGVLRLRNIFEIWPDDAGANAGRLSVRDAAGAETILLNGDSGEATVKVLTITGGADIAEPFTMSEAIPPGSVVVIDEKHPGQLKLSERAYDTCVAGIVSGANGIHPGLALHQKGVLEGGQNVALTGRVYALADASSGPIQPGDLLTTSGTPGHCMKAGSPARAQGAILGKAMTGLPSGKGLVLVLVTLQ